MGKIAFVFSGQGDQYPGMGKELAEKYEAAKKIYELCERIRPGTTKQCFEGTKEELKETKNAQPCLFAVELAAANVLRSRGILPAVAAGFSLGEVAAAAFSGIFDIKTGFRLVCRRGELMQQDAEKFDTSMAAVLKLTKAQVWEICNKYSEIFPVNFNCPGQISVSGCSSQMGDFFADVKKQGGRAVLLNVQGAFHSPFMKSAAEIFAKELKQVQMHNGTIELYSNVTAEPYTNAAAELLSKQICSPVLWEKIIENMIADGVDSFIEIGPGKTLTNMIKKINPKVTAKTVMEYLSEAEGC